MIQSIALAKAAWWLAGIVYKIRRYGIPAAFKLVALSERLAPDHWSHLVYDHEVTGCAGGRCPECGGTICTQNYDSEDIE